MFSKGIAQDLKIDVKNVPYLKSLNEEPDNHIKLPLLLSIYNIVDEAFNILP